MEEDSSWEQNGATLFLKDVADFGLADGQRFAFLETEQGLVFDRSAYASLAGTDSLEEVEEYMEKMTE